MASEFTEATTYNDPEVEPAGLGPDDGATSALAYEAVMECVRPEVLGPALAAAVGDDRWIGLTVELIAGGKSNLTFELASEAGTLILRRPPMGAILASAHDMGREARVQRALMGTDVPVAEVMFEDIQGGLIGSPFYVMEKVPGRVIRDELPDGYAPSDSEKAAMADALVDALIALHSVEPETVALGDYGRPSRFVERQIRRWYGQWGSSKTAELPVIDELAGALRDRVPTAPYRSCIVHGDFRLDNCLMDLTDPGRVAAVLDWELSTLGDPMTDLGLLLFYWCEAGEPVPLLTPAITQQPGFPKRAHLSERYLSATGVEPEDLAFFEGFAHFKFAVIAQGIAARVAAGAMAGQQFGDIETEVARIATEGLSRLRGNV